MRGAVLEYSGTRHRAWRTALAWLDRPVRTEGPRAALLVADDRELERVRARVQASTGEVDTVRAASGPPVAPHADPTGSFSDALRLLRVRADEVVGWDGAGLLQALLGVPDDRLADFVQQHLGPVLGRPELLETLRVWLATRGSRQAASERLHLHRNSVGYRVRRLRLLLQADPLEPGRVGVLQAALDAHDLLASGRIGWTSESPVLRADHTGEVAPAWR